MKKERAFLDYRKQLPFFLWFSITSLMMCYLCQNFNKICACACKNIKMVVVRSVDSIKNQTLKTTYFLARKTKKPSSFF